MRDEFAGAAEPADVRAALHDLGRRLALRIVAPEVIAIRRLLISEARAFPEFAKQYFDRAPGQVINALTSGFDQLVHRRLLKATDTRRAAGQFAYLIAGEQLDRALLVGTLPPKQHIIESAREGVETFLARYSPR